MTTEEQKRLYDASCKAIIAERYIAANILKSCAAEFRGLSVEEIATHCIEGNPAIATIPVVPPDLPTKVSGLGQESLDAHAAAVTFDAVLGVIVPPFDSPAQLVINFESQDRANPGYPLLKRSIFYAASLIRDQYGKVFTKSHYEKIRKVYSIWICPRPPKAQEYSINLYQTCERHLEGCYADLPEHYDLLNVVTINLGSKQYSELSGIFRMLNALFLDRMKPTELKGLLEKEYAVRLTPELEKGMKEMCNLSEGVYADGIALGMERGIAQGRQEMMLDIESRAKKMFARGLDIADIQDFTGLPLNRLKELQP